MVFFKVIPGAHLQYNMSHVIEFFGNVMDRIYVVITLRGPGVANFIELIKIKTMFVKTKFKGSNKDLKSYKWNIKVHSISAFLVITKVADFRWRNADVRRTQRVCNMIYILLEDYLGEYNCVKFLHFRICVTEFKEEGLYHPPSLQRTTPKRRILNKVNK